MKTKITILCSAVMFVGFATVDARPRLINSGRSGFIYRPQPAEEREDGRRHVQPRESNERPKTMALMVPKKQTSDRKFHHTRGRSGFVAPAHRH